MMYMLYERNFILLENRKESLFSEILLFSNEKEIF